MSKTPDIGHIDVVYVANLARLELTPDEKTSFQQQLDHILEYIRKLNEADVSQATPIVQGLPSANVLRADETRPCLATTLAMDNAPVAIDSQFVVPKILE